MNIIPDSSVYFCRNVEINKQNQRDFNSLNEQFNYFNQRKVAQADRCYFIKTNGGQWSGSIKVAIPYQTLYNCDYFFYRNSGFLTKYFYSYIDSVEYVDTTTTRVNFTVDHYQTWVLDYKIKYGEVIRHTVQRQDAIIRNKNLYPDIQYDNQYIAKATSTWDFGSDKMCILLYAQSKNLVSDMLLQIDFQAQQGQYYPGVVFIYRMNDPERYKKLEEDLYAYGLTLKFDKCVIMPNFGGIFDSSNCWPSGTEVVSGIQSKGEVLKQQTTPIYEQHVFSLNAPERFNDNFKIMNQPYIKYQLVTQSGDQIDNINAALINQTDTALIVAAVPLLWPDPMVVLYVYDYDGVQEIQDTGLPDYLKFNRYSKLVIRDFPNITTNEVGLQSLASQLISLQMLPLNPLVTQKAMLIGGAVANAPISVMQTFSKGSERQATDFTSNKLSGFADKSEKVAGLANSKDYEQLSNKRNKIIDFVENAAASPMSFKSGGQCSLWQQTFRFQISLVMYENTCIDKVYDTFKRYGYTDVSFDINTKQRPLWDYIQTASCSVQGDIPEEAKRYIEQMYNDGVTFWHDDDIYNYDRDNF